MTTDAVLATSGSRRPVYIPSLDGLRAIAVGLVLWAHVPRASLGKLLDLASFVVQPGYTGVDVFFVLSGFLITRLLLSDKDQPRSLRNFLARRFLRIFPIYYLTIFALVFVEPGWYLLWSALYVSNVAFAFDDAGNPLRHTWSLAVEEHYYLAWPLLVHRVSNHFLWRVALVLLALAASLAFVTVLFVSNPAPADLISRITVYRAFSLVAGSMLALKERQVSDDEDLARRIAFVLVAVGGLFVGLSKVLSVGGFDWLPLGRLVGFGAVSTGVVLWLIVDRTRTSILTVVLSTRLLREIGKISYGLYLYHFPIFYWFGFRDEGSNPSLALVCLAVGISVLVAVLSYRLIESPVLQLKKRFR